MPITLPPITRRRFLEGSLAAGTGLMTAARLPAAEQATGGDRFVLMADTHIAADRDAVVRGAHMFRHLQQAARETAELAPRPQAALINGDCAYLAGESGDYEVLAELLEPIRKAGTAVHLTLGNHDHRERFRRAIPSLAIEDPPVADRHAMVIPSRHANWFLLDSLERTNHTPGTLGQRQLEWLDRELLARRDQPALVVAHHNPDVRERISGLTDTRALFTVLHKHAHVGAYVFGHTHSWDVRKDERDLYLINLPPVAYVFGAGRPSGWVDVRLTASGATMRLNSLDKNHAKHGETISLTWRT
jgi:metallophosphoesterase superfamily enzyme